MIGDRGGIERREGEKKRKAKEGKRQKKEK